MKIGRIAAAVVVVIAAGTAGYVYFGRNAKESSFVTARARRGSIAAVVAATGTVSPLITVTVGSQVSGQVSALYADFNSEVKKGQLIAKLDASNLEAQVARDRANLAASRANLERVRVEAENAERSFRRASTLRHQNLLSDSDFDAASAAASSAAAAVRTAEAAIEQSQASLRISEVNLDHAAILSPVDGIVISRTVDVGQTVAASLQAPTLFTIAQDLRKMQVHMNVAEADIGRLAVAQDATFSVDAYPETRFEGRISAIRNSPTTIQNVVTYEAVIDVDNEDLRLKPGMTANVSVVVDRREDALRVPNAALRFRPPEGAVIAEREQEADGSAETRASSAPGSPGPGAGEPGESVRGRPEGGQARRGGSGRGRSEDQEPPVSGRGADEAGPGAGRWPNAGREGPSGSGGGRRGPGRGGPPRSSVWMVEGTGVRRVSVSVGITDGAFTEIVGGGIEEGDEVVTEIAGAQSAAPARTTRPGFGRLF